MTRLALALDDEQIWRNAVKDAALGLGLEVETFDAFDRFRARFQQVSADLVVLDWNMPGRSGLEVLNWIREGRQPDVPVIMLTSRGSDDDIIAALGAGADDYVSKPCSTAVLAARINTHLNRIAVTGDDRNASPRYGDVVFDDATKTAQRSIPTEQLTDKEYAIARLLFASLNAPVARETVYAKVWGQSELVNSRSLDTHIASLRKKLGLRPANGYKLSPVYGFGYRLETVTTG
ncbi:MAG: DNA-binding response regulator [Citromicrobium sp.]|nr:MAG: DNA-binding response regulator [Citromicrobium sp.]